VRRYALLALAGMILLVMISTKTKFAIGTWDRIAETPVIQAMLGRTLLLETTKITEETMEASAMEEAVLVQTLEVMIAVEVLVSVEVVVFVLLGAVLVAMAEDVVVVVVGMEGVEELDVVVVVAVVEAAEVAVVVIRIRNVNCYPNESEHGCFPKLNY